MRDIKKQRAVSPTVVDAAWEEMRAFRRRWCYAGPWEKVGLIVTFTGFLVERLPVAKLTSLAVALGFGLLSAYFLQFRAFPSVTFSEVSLLLFQALVAGFVLFLVFFVLIGLPVLPGAWITSKVSEEKNGVNKGTFFLVLASCIASISLLFWVLLPTSSTLHTTVVRNWSYWVALVVSVALCLFIVYKWKWTPTPVSLWKLIKTVGLSFILAPGPFVAVVVLMSNAGQVLAWSDWFGLLVVLIIFSVDALIASLQGTPGLVKSAMVLMLTLVIFVAISPTPFPRFVAVMLGIAEKHPVSLIVKHDGCQIIRSAEAKLKGILVPCCDDKSSSVIENVYVDNTVGTWWFIRLSEKTPVLKIPSSEVLGVQRPLK